MQIEGTKETVMVYSGENFDKLIKHINGDPFYDGNNRMRVQMVTK